MEELFVEWYVQAMDIRAIINFVIYITLKNNSYSHNFLAIHWAFWLGSLSYFSIRTVLNKLESLTNGP